MKNTGMETPATEIAMMTRSLSRPRRTAAKVPSARPSGTNSTFFPCQGALRQFIINANALGSEGSLAHWQRGASVLEAVPAELEAFYRDGFARAARTLEHWAHDYECSSSSVFPSVASRCTAEVRRRTALKMTTAMTAAAPNSSRGSNFDLTRRDWRCSDGAR